MLDNEYWVPELSVSPFSQEISLFTFSPFSREISPFLAFQIVPDCSPCFYNTVRHDQRT
jgi:hypothetical protein